MCGLYAKPKIFIISYCFWISSLGWWNTERSLKVVNFHILFYYSLCSSSSNCIRAIHNTSKYNLMERQLGLRRERVRETGRRGFWEKSKVHHLFVHPAFKKNKTFYFEIISHLQKSYTRSTKTSIYPSPT